ncbi:MAG: hypothetical protein BWX86_02187 [Verrucomicrobia bacterium ADurb.Bin122]|nr:MAG: hypothetical protein BWX86_02187 [Verrucomicrobia bacterium ADurb.Bin122]
MLAGGGEAVAQVVEAQMSALDLGLRREQPQPAARMGERLLRVFQAGFGVCGEGFGGACGAADAVDEAAGDELGGGAGCLGAHVGGEIAEREIDLVADGGDDRQAAGGDGAHERLFVEGPQILDAAASPADHEQVENPECLGLRELCDHVGGGAFALDLGGQHDEPAAPVATLEDADEILHGGARRRGDESDGRGHRRERKLVLRGEQTLGGEALLERLELPLEAADAILDHGADDELVLPARLVEAESAKGHDLLAVAQAHALPRGVAAKHHRAELRAGILERKVNVAAGLCAQIGDLALDPAGLDAAFEQTFHAAREVGDRFHAVAGLTVKRAVAWTHAAVAAARCFLA